LWEGWYKLYAWGHQIFKYGPKSSALKNVTEEVKKYKIPFVAIQEVYWTGNGTIKFNDTNIYSNTQNNKYEKEVDFIDNEIQCYTSNRL
jgi:hypothetical protein